ncbi:GTPase-activating Rap/Ran-GAP domain-like protein 3 [Labeo rohita]|uniref:GTPase-activating Rap/Ran-GAP domain-like protein 3 n=1 Tax=Labeo rohita TaxID=84645 RepID=A0ABQ8MP48_LABRO|nr:GTPase-activating Rap/Ran-GAP domain-like protein 3 [Labeo rohita]
MRHHRNVRCSGRSFYVLECSSASEDLGCRRGEFSRKHYGSVELIVVAQRKWLSTTLDVTSYVKRTGVWSARYREEGREREGGRPTGGEERWEKCEEENKVTEEKGNGRGSVFCCLATNIVPSGGMLQFYCKDQITSCQLISSDADGAIQRAGRFRVENGSIDETSDYTPGTWRRTDVHLENPEYHTRWYFKYFLGKVHQNYVGTDAEKNPFFLSVVLSDQNNQRIPQYRAILWRKTGTLKISLPYSPTKTLSVKSILSAMNVDRFEKGPREILNPEIQKDLLVLEEQEGSVNFKFGVLYAKDGQLTDDEMFSNESGSETFDKFLNLLGDTICLQGWAGYRGGLDTKNDTTGINSIYTVYQGHELMFHVSTMLPYSKENKQQVERKRHIGNDIVTIVFQEGDDASPSFKPSMIRSHFTLINGEKATLETPTFAQKRQRTLDMLIRSLYQDLMPDMPKVPFSPQNMLNRRSFSDVLPESPKSARKKEEARQAEFVRVGQALKLKTIVRGDAPTSLVTTGLCRKEPWESQSFCSSFPYDIVCGDSWGQSLLVFDKTLTVKQMHVLEPQDLLIARADKGCHLYSINTHHGVELRIVAAIRNKLLLITRKQSRLDCLSSVATVTGTSDSPVEEFQYIREICLCDSPVVMALVDGPTGENDHMICVAYRHQFDLINESTGDAYRLHHVDSNRVNFVAAIDVYEDGEAGLLLCYNNICVYKKVCPFNGATPMIQPNTSDFHFSWNQMPNAIVCAFPYILAFTTDSIEIRLVSDIYFISSAPINSASNCSSRDTSSQSSPQTPTGYEMPVFPSPLGDDCIRIPYGTKLSLYMSKDSEGEAPSKHIYKIPLSNLVGRSIERPLKSPLVNKVLTAPTPSVIGPAPMIASTTSLSLSRMEIKEIASRTRKELLGLTEEPSSKADGNSVKQRRMSKKTKEEEQRRTAEISTTEQVGMESLDGETDVQRLCSSGSELEPRDDSPPTASPFTFSTSFEEDILDLK